MRTMIDRRLFAASMVSLGMLGSSCGEEVRPQRSSSGAASARTEVPAPDDEGGPSDSTGDPVTASQAPAAKHVVEVTPGPDGGPPDAPGVIRGVVVFDGEPPKRSELKITAAGCNHEGGPVLKEDLVVNEGKVQYAYVYVSKGLKGREFEAPKEPVFLDQIGCMYSPHVVCIQTGQALHVRNSDATMHNVNWPDGNKMQPAGSDAIEIEYQRDSVGIMYRCDIHPWMSAFLCVSEHPYHQVTGADGSFSLPAIPPGEYELSLWTEKYKKDGERPTVQVPPGGEVTVTFHISDKDRGRRRRGR